jgi:hypothetical protein
MNSTFEQVSAAAARVLARQAAIRLAKDEITRRGGRSALANMPMRELQIIADGLLRERPHLIEEAVQRVAREPERWLPKRALRSVSVSDHARSATENATEKAQPQSELIAR